MKNKPAAKTAAHTPGPWGITVDPMTMVSYVGPAGKYPKVAVAAIKTVGKSEDTVSANARLIAAAPELLAALKTLLVHWASLPGTAGQGTFGAKIGDQALAAIAKAEGGSK